MKKKYAFPFYLALAILFALPFQAWAQLNNTSIGSWRTHLPYTSVTTVAQAGSRIYAASPSSFFCFDTEDNSLQVLSKTEGFSEVGISKIKYHEQLDILLIAYSSGNIDLLKKNKITNVSDIVRAISITGSRRINHINFYKDLAYISCDFGIVVLDLIKNEVKESFMNIGENASQLSVFSSTILNDTLYIASRNEVRAGALANNLSDYQWWRKADTTFSLPQADTYQLVTFNNKVYAGAADKGLYVLENFNWTRTDTDIASPVQSINVSNNSLVLSAQQQVITVNTDHSSTSIQPYPDLNPAEAITDEKGTVWIADKGRGLIAVTNDNPTVYQPNGPYSASTVKFHIHDNKVVALPGGIRNHAAAYNPTGYYILDDNGWTSYGPIHNNVNNVYFLDPLTATTTPDGSMYVGLFGYGILKRAPDGTHSLINENTPGSTLKNIFPGSPYVRIQDLAADKEGNLWISNLAAVGVNDFPEKLHVKSPDDTWKAFNFSKAEIGGNGISQILIDDSGYKWLSLGNLGILVFDDQTNKRRNLTTTAGHGSLPSNLVNTMALDKNGEIWIGTASGVAVFYAPYQVFDGTAFDAAVPFFKINATQASPLLQGEVINAIEVDGANRKWIGTTKGVYLLSADGSEQVHYFNTNNSPLISNYVLDIAIHPVTGEVFMATDKGIVSYRGTATEATDKFESVKVFPNPVRPEFTGQIAITGLAANTNVKITDINGKLVYETFATGGTAVWDQRDYNGRKARTGIYLVFSATEDGSEGHVAKFALIE
jgi:ligand-binding sensor domain-containing protein